jgi:DNA-binding PadR family transcriptional regulator
MVENDTLVPTSSMTLRPGDMQVLAILPDIMEAGVPMTTLLRLIAQEGLTIAEIGARLRAMGAPVVLTRPAGLYPALQRLERAGLVASEDPEQPGSMRVLALDRRRYWRTSIGTRRLHS